MQWSDPFAEDSVADLDEVLTLCRKNGRVCPTPDPWHKMFKRLEVDGASPFDREDLMVPLILGGWWATGDGDKVHRLEHQVRWAESHGVLNRIARSLARLPNTGCDHRGFRGRESRDACIAPALHRQERLEPAIDHALAVERHLRHVHFRPGITFVAFACVYESSRT